MKIRQSRDLSVYYYPILFFTYTIALFSNKVSCGTVATVLMLIIAFKNIKIHKISKMDMLIYYYIIYSILSVIWFSKSGLPISVFVTAFSYSVLPIVFYFLGKRDENGRFIIITIYAIVYSLILGIVLYVTAPQFYGDYLVYHSNASQNGVGWIQQAMQSFYGVTATGTFSAILVIFAFMKTMKNKNKKNILILAIGLISIYLSARRSSWLGIIIVLIYFHYLLYFKWKKLNLLNFIVEIMILIMFLILVSIFLPDSMKFIVEKLNSFSNAIGERSENWVIGLSNVSNILIGNGLGSMGHIVQKYGVLGVYDSGYINVLCELGAIGIILLLIIILTTFVSAIKKTKFLYMEIGIITLYLIQSIGSNIFEFQVLMPLFWYSIGKIFGQKENV